MTRLKEGRLLMKFNFCDLLEFEIDWKAVASIAVVMMCSVLFK